MGQLHDSLTNFMMAIQNYLDSMGAIKRGFINAYIGSTPINACIITEREACTFMVSKGPKVTLMDGKAASPDAILRLTQAELDRMFEGTVEDYDRKVAQGIIKVEIYTGRGQQLINQVREAFGAQG
jgi:hypothetical protein